MPVECDCCVWSDCFHEMNYAGLHALCGAGAQTTCFMVNIQFSRQQVLRSFWCSGGTSQRNRLFAVNPTFIFIVKLLHIIIYDSWTDF